jgi:hypothetical protein
MKDPKTLPDGWEEFRDDSDKKYFGHPESGEQGVGCPASLSLSMRKTGREGRKGRMGRV